MSDLSYSIDFDSAPSLGELWNIFRSLRGRWRVTVKRDRAKRSTQQNRYYWGAVVRTFALWLKESQGDDWSEDDAHEILKDRFGFKREVIDPETGEIKQVVRSTTTYSTAEFTEYCMKCERWMIQFCGTKLPSQQLF